MDRAWLCWLMDSLGYLTMIVSSSYNEIVRMIDLGHRLALKSKSDDEYIGKVYLFEMSEMLNV